MFPKCQKKQLKFSTFHGANVRLSTDKYLAQGYYLKAHGQFILENELYPGQNFDLEFRGTGILKLQGFESKYQAEEWVRSKKTLGKGSIRIRTKKTLRYHVSVPSEGSSILLSTKRTDDRQDKLDGNILAFDIEYGDVIVMIWKELNSRSVQFDSTCHSHHVDIVNSPRVSHASLVHYNPTSLCTPFNCPVRPGDSFQLAVTGPDDEKTTGSYVRLCLSKKHNEYNNDQERFEGSRNTPEFKGKRMMVKPRAGDCYILTVEDNRISIERKGTQILYLDAPIKRGDFGLWFEVHKATLQLWRLRVQYDLEMGAPHIYAPPPPPPPRSHSRESYKDYSSSPMVNENHYISLHQDDSRTCMAPDGIMTGNSSQLRSSDSDSGNGQSIPLTYETSTQDQGYDYCSCYNDLTITSPQSTPQSISVFRTLNIHNNIAVGECQERIQTSMHEEGEEEDSDSSFWISYHLESCRLVSNLSSRVLPSAVSSCHSMTSNATFGFGGICHQSSQHSDSTKPITTSSGSKVNDSDQSDAHIVTMNHVNKTLSKHQDDNSDAVSQYSEYTIDDSTYLKCIKTST